MPTGEFLKIIIHYYLQKKHELILTHCSEINDKSSFIFISDMITAKD
jgi:hypothetical protein